MKSYLCQLPLSPSKWTGEEGTAPLELEESGVSPIGQLTYSLRVEFFQGKLSAIGSLNLGVRLQCVVCLRAMADRIQIDDFSVQRELAGKKSIDLTPFIREDTLLTVPSYPRCESASHPSSSAELSAVSTQNDRSPLPAWRILKTLTLKGS
jgi:uncharacterized metal-binding protein YceD (DUF177 family)